MRFYTLLSIAARLRPFNPSLLRAPPPSVLSVAFRRPFSSLTHLASPSPSASIRAATSRVPLTNLSLNPTAYALRSALAQPSSSASLRLLSTSHRSAENATDADTDASDKRARPRRYEWIDEEARELIKKAYARHKALADKSQSFPPSLSVADLERIGTPYHYTPKDMVDRVALGLMKFLRVFVHAFFREKYDHHAVCLETVAAVPGLVGSFHRHLRSLRRMKRDYGWITLLQEEMENERMHLLIFMRVCEPTAVERTLVIVAQAMYLSFYSLLYLVHPRGAHRLTGYLEEEAHRAYTDYIASIDAGKIPNRPAPDIARWYYHLPESATMRDVILHVRADESMHRDANHHLGNKYGLGDTDSSPDIHA